MGIDERRQVLAELLALRERFREAHHIGMDCLRRGDYNGLGESVRIEREIIDEQARLIERLRKLAPQP